MKISVVTPIYNEAENIPLLIEQLTSVLSSLGNDFEIIAVNDGSKDASLRVLKSIALNNNHLKVISFLTNYGQTAALSAGIKHSVGDIIVTIDSDLENDPADIPRLLEKLSEGFDVVSGWRQNRWPGKFISRRLPSMCANKLISLITHVNLHDYGCILKAYKREVIVGLDLYGEMHRFIPAYAAWQGALVTEIPVNFKPRIHGSSNYGLSRTFRVLLDLILLKFLDRYLNKPIHFFGGLGFLSFGGGVVAGLIAVILKLVRLRDFVSTPLPIFSALLIIVGVQLIAMGIIAELVMRTYYESQDKMPYFIKEKINF